MYETAEGGGWIGGMLSMMTKNLRGFKIRRKHFEKFGHPRDIKMKRNIKKHLKDFVHRKWP